MQGHTFYEPSKLRVQLHVWYNSHISADNVTKQHYIIDFCNEDELYIVCEMRTIRVVLNVI